MRLSRESQYGLLGLCYLAQREPGIIVQVAQISTEANLPKAFLAKIFRKLALSGILHSYRGKERGFSLARPPSEISVREVIEAVEGPDFFKRCIFWSGHCSEEEPCMLHGIWKDLRPRVSARLGDLSMAQLIDHKIQIPS